MLELVEHFIPLTRGVSYAGVSSVYVTILFIVS
jgi:hypothetical protein